MKIIGVRPARSALALEVRSILWYNCFENAPKGLTCINISHGDERESRNGSGNIFLQIIKLE